MAELTPQERLQPSLLDRLTDEEPGNPREGADRRIMSLNQLKASVLRDLAWLFNTTALFDPDTGMQIPAGSSVLNYGLPALADVHLAARSLYIERFGTDAERAAFNAQVDELVFRERVRVLKRTRAARP